MEEKDIDITKQDTTDVDNLQSNAETSQCETEEESAEEKIIALEEEIEKLKDINLRQVAEFDNYRKRTMKEKAELILNGSEKTIKELLPILDDFDRDLQNTNDNTSVETLKEGLELISKKFEETLNKQGLKRIATESEDFNVDYHEAIALVPVDDDSKKGKIIDCVSTGYMLNEKVIRHAKVAVGQ